MEQLFHSVNMASNAEKLIKLRSKNADDLTDALEQVPIHSLMYCNPRGMGKTTFFDGVFTSERILGLAGKKKVLLHRMVLFPRDVQTDAGIFVCLIKGVEEAMDLLPEELRREVGEFLLEKKAEHADFQTNPTSAQTLLENVAKSIVKRGYHITFLIDDFHHLYKRDKKSQENLEALASLAQKKLLSYIVASDYYPYTELEDGTVSTWLRIFAFEHLNALDERALPGVMELIRTALAKAKSQVIIREEELRTIRNWTGGIPGLLREGVNALYDYKCGDPDGTPDEETLRVLLMNACKATFEEWISRLSEEYRKTLQAIVCYGTDESLKRLPVKIDKNSGLPVKTDKSSELTDMGLVSRDSRSRSTPPWKVICPLFQAWLEEELGRPQAAEQELPWQTALKQLSSMGGNLQGFGAYLANLFTTGLLPVQASAGTASEGLVDAKVQEVSQQLVQDVDVFDITPEELETLESCFQDARKKRPELSDEILLSQSPQCQFYLKLSVVVDKALSFTEHFTNTDCSPQLVLYGKAYEQALRDCLYLLFSSDLQLSSYDMYSQLEDPGSRNAFCNKQTARNANISDYCMLIQCQAQHLSDLCSSDRSLRGKGYDSAWWLKLQSDMDRARRIRNMLHPDDYHQPHHGDLENIISCLLGEDGHDGILTKLNVGRQLANNLTGLNELSPTVANRYIHQEYAVEVEKILTNGGLRSRMLEGSHLVKISKNQAKAYRERNNADFYEGMILSAHIESYTYQDGEHFFSGSLVGR